MFDPALGPYSTKEEVVSGGQREEDDLEYSRSNYFYCPKLYAINEAGLTIGGVVGIVIACVVVVAAIIVVTVICIKKKGSTSKASSSMKTTVSQ